MEERIVAGVVCLEVLDFAIGVMCDQNDKKEIKKTLSEPEIAGILINAGIYIGIFWIFISISDISAFLSTKCINFDTYSEGDYALYRLMFKGFVPIMAGLLWMLLGIHISKILNFNVNVRRRFLIFLGVLFFCVFIYVTIMK